MRYLRLTLLTLATIAVAAMTMAAGTANGAPSAVLTPTHLTSVDNGTITSTLRNASFVEDAGALRVVDRTGKTVETVALSVPLNGVDVPLRADVSADGTSATLTPTLTDQARAAIAAGMHPASAAKDRAWAKMVWHINNGWNRGGGVATAVGALIGLVVGCIVIVGCIWGAGVGAAIGAVVGINNGDPRAGQAILNWINTP